MSQFKGQRDPESLLVKISTGQTRPYPQGHRLTVEADVSELKLYGFVEAVPVVRTNSGYASFHPIEDEAQGVAGLERKLRRQREDGKPLFMRKAQWDALSKKEREAFITKTPAIDPKDAEIAALRAQLAQQASPPKAVA